MFPVLLDLQLTDTYRLTVGGYGLAGAVAVLGGTWLAMWTGARNGLGKEAALDLVIFHILGVLIGAKGVQLVVEWDRFAANPWAIFSVREMGVFYGGLLGSLVAVTLRARARGVDPWHAWDTLAPAFALSHAVARVGCFLAGCCYGRPSAAFGLAFPARSAAYRSLLHADPSLLRGGETVPLLPIQLVEAAAEVGVGALLLWLLARRPRPGVLALTYVGTYAILRFILEFFRFDPERGMLLGGLLSTSQLIALLMLGAVLLAATYRYRPRPPA